MGTWMLFFAYFVSVLGSVVGLACTLQARSTEGKSRIGWLALAAVSIGGVGIWLMHFIAMLGFDTPGLPVRYDIGKTALSAALSIGATFIGLLVFGVRTRFALWRLLVGGLITGLAVNLMHYTGMWAVEIKGTITYDPLAVWLSILIAVVAATAAFWFTVLFDRLIMRILAGLVMGLAVTGMHYTGMAAVQVHLDSAAPTPGGVEVFSFLFPVFVLSVLALAVPIYAVLMSSTWSDTDADLRMPEPLSPLERSRQSRAPRQVMPQAQRPARPQQRQVQAEREREIQPVQAERLPERRPKPSAKPQARHTVDAQPEQALRGFGESSDRYARLDPEDTFPPMPNPRTTHR